MEYVAIVGTTGCGKSTLMRLLLGFETPEKGAIYYDGKDMTKLDLRSLRRRIGAVTQDGSLFQGDIYENIVISAPSVVAELENIARQRMAEGDDRDSCADYIRTLKYNELCIMNEAEGFDYMMDFYYINMVIDRIYGISV